MIPSSAVFRTLQLAMFVRSFLILNILHPHLVGVQLTGHHLLKIRYFKSTRLIDWLIIFKVDVLGLKSPMRATKSPWHLFGFS